LRVDSRWAERDFVLDFASDAERRVRLPADPAARFALTLEQLQLRASSDLSSQRRSTGRQAGGLAGSRRAAWRGLQDARLPETDVQVRHAALDDKDLGEWRSAGSEVDALAMTDACHAARTASSASARTAVAASACAGLPASHAAKPVVGVRSDDIERFFAVWGYKRAGGPRGARRGRFSWPGNPVQFEMANVAECWISPGVTGACCSSAAINPFMRTLGMMNFDEVLRRIRFDFKDLYQSGLAFDRFDGVIELGQGFAHTREPITLEGPSARMKFSGRSDLRAQTIDADLIVTLPIGSNLPWVAALAGGLPAAAGIYVASRIFEDQLGKFSSAIYKVSGKLDDPAVEFVKVFDTEDGQDDKSAAPARGEPA
jgi:uncharacterized protein YhdP